MYYYNPMMSGYDWGWGVIMILLWFFVIALILVVAARFLRNSHTSQKMDSPIDIAKERYARGEITKEQFDQLKKDLA